MSRPLPVIAIDGTQFEVDLRRMEFRQLDNPGNRISFYDLEDQGDHLVLLVDTKTKSAYQGSDWPRKSRVQPVKLPPLKALDPFLYTLLQGRADHRLDLLQKAARILNPPPQRHETRQNKRL